MGWGAEKAHRLLPKKVTQDPTPSVIGIRQKSVPDRRNCICKGREVRERRAYERKLELEMAGTQAVLGRGYKGVGFRQVQDQEESPVLGP